MAERERLRGAASNRRRLWPLPRAIAHIDLSPTPPLIGSWKSLAHLIAPVKHIRGGRHGLGRTGTPL